MIKITPQQLTMLNSVHNAAPAFFAQLLKKFPAPAGDGLGDTASTGWISSVSNFITQNLPTYLQYKNAQNLISSQSQQTYTPAQTQAVLAQQGIGVSGGNNWKLIGAGVAGLIVIGALVFKKRKRR